MAPSGAHKAGVLPPQRPCTGLGACIRAGICAGFGAFAAHSVRACLIVCIASHADTPPHTGGSLASHFLTSYQKSLVAVLAAQFGRKSLVGGKQAVFMLTSTTGKAAGWDSVCLCVGARMSMVLISLVVAHSSEHSRAVAACLAWFSVEGR